MMDFQCSEDSAILTYETMAALVQAVTLLVATGQPFAVSPRHHQVTTSTRAARLISIL